MGSPKNSREQLTRIKMESMRLIAYARGSTEEQELTLEAQPDKMQAYAALYEHDIVALIAKSESAKSLDREGIQDALARLRNNEADGLLVVKLDRLTRELDDWQYLLKQYFGERSKYAKHLFSVNDYVDTRTATGRMILNMQITIAQWERETIGERTRAALQHKIKNGERCGRIRYGYDLAPDGKLLVPNDAEQRAIALMKQLRNAGYSLQAIATELDDREIPTKEGGPWSHAAVRRILKRVHDTAA